MKMLNPQPPTQSPGSSLQSRDDVVWGKNNKHLLKATRLEGAKKDQNRRKARRRINYNGLVLGAGRDISSSAGILRFLALVDL